MRKNISDVPSLIGRSVIGLDETNNRFQMDVIESSDGSRSGKGLPMIVTGCHIPKYPRLRPDIKKEPRYGKHGVFSRDNGVKDEVIPEFLEDHVSLFPNFYYTKITQDVSDEDMGVEHICAISRVLLNFFERDRLNEDTYIVIDRIGGEKEVTFMDETLRILLNCSNLYEGNSYDEHVFIKASADSLYHSCFGADRLGYGIM